MSMPAPYSRAESGGGSGSQPDAEYVNTPDSPYRDDAQRKAAMRRAYKAYKGKLPRPLKADKNGVNHSLRENRLRQIVDKGVAFLFGKPVTFAVEEKAPAGAQDWLNALMAANDQETTLQAYAQNGGIFGHPFLKVIPNGIIAKGVVYPRLMVLDPLQVTVECAENDPQCVCAYSIEFQGKGPDGKPCQRRQRFERELPDGMDDDDVPLGSPDVSWVVREQYRKAATLAGQDPNAAWADMPGDDGEPSYWCDPKTNKQLPWSPIFDNQNLIEANSYYGAADLDDDLIELNVGINRAISDAAKIIYYWGSPKLWSAGLDAHQITMSAEDVTCLPGEGQSLNMLEMAGDLPAIHSFIKHLLEAMDELGGFPGVALGRLDQMPAGDVPGITMRLMFLSAQVKTDVKRGTYGNMLEQLCSRLLELGGFGAGWSVGVHWGDPLPVSWTELAAMAQELTAIGVSKGRIMEMLGLDPKEEAARVEEETAAAPPPPAPTLADLAMQKFNQGADIGNGANPYPPQANQGNMAALNSPKAIAARQAMASIGSN